MRAPSNPILSVIAAVGLAVAGCASQPKHDQSSRAADMAACADDVSNPLHLTTLRKKETPRDPQLESLLNQGGGPRLQQINREMYQTLRALDAELRREQQVAACHGAVDIQSLKAQAPPRDAGSGNGVGNAVNSGAGAVAAGGPSAASAGGGGVGGVATAGGTSAGGINGVAGVGGFASSGATGTNGLTTLVRRASVPATTSGVSGNGAAAQKVSAGSDNDIVARRLRKAAEQETDPTLKARLWKEYAQYQQGSGAK